MIRWKVKEKGDRIFFCKVNVYMFLYMGIGKEVGYGVGLDRKVNKDRSEGY